MNLKPSKLFPKQPKPRYDPGRILLTPGKQKKMNRRMKQREGSSGCGEVQAKHQPFENEQRNARPFENMINCFRDVFIATKAKLGKVRKMMFPRDDVAIECNPEGCKRNPMKCKIFRAVVCFLGILFLVFLFTTLTTEKKIDEDEQVNEVKRPPQDCSIEIGENMKEEIRAWIQKEIQNNAKLCKNNRISPEQIRGIIKDEIKRQQKIQLKPDFASASAGGMVIEASPTWTEGYSYIYFLFIPIRSMAPPPSIILEPTRQAGDCWPMLGQKGNLLIQLAARAYILGFTLEHIDPAMSLSGGIPEAPNNFSVYGLETLEHRDKRHLLGTYCYDNKIEEESQYFRVQNTNRKSFIYIQVEISSNHGNEKYTCLYRFQVHGYIDRAYHCQK